MWGEENEEAWEENDLHADWEEQGDMKIINFQILGIVERERRNNVTSCVNWAAKFSEGCSSFNSILTFYAGLGSYISYIENYGISDSVTDILSDKVSASRLISHTDRCSFASDTIIA